MFRGLLVSLATYIALVVDSAAALAWADLPGRPLFIPLVLSSVICRFSTGRALLAAALIGLAADCVTTAGPGPLMLAMVVLTWLVHACFESRWLESLPVALLLVLIVSETCAVLPTLVVWIRDRATDRVLANGFWEAALWSSLVTVGLACLLKTSQWMLLRIFAGVLPESRDRLGNRWSMLTG